MSPFSPRSLFPSLVCLKLVNERNLFKKEGRKEKEGGCDFCETIIAILVSRHGVHSLSVRSSSCDAPIVTKFNAIIDKLRTFSLSFSLSLSRLT